MAESYDVTGKNNEEYRPRDLIECHGVSAFVVHYWFLWMMTTYLLLEDLVLHGSTYQWRQEFRYNI